MYRVCAILLAVALSVQGQQRNPPGVNPQQYQQGAPPPPPGQPQQFQGQPQQFQGQPQNFQGQPQNFQGQPQNFQGQPQQPMPGQPQQPMQQVQQPVQQAQQARQPPPPPQQQQPQQPAQQARAPHGHNHGHGHGEQKVLHRDMKHEKEHMKEHMEVPIDTTNMSEQELQFHYFKMHDTDGNNKLDGCELVKSLIHWHDQSNHDASSGQPIPEAKIFKDDELRNMIDPILEADDRNKDGFIDYPEFVAAQQAAAGAASAE